MQDTPCAVLAIRADMALSGFTWLLDCIFRPVPVLCVLVAYRLRAEAEVLGRKRILRPIERISKPAGGGGGRVVSVPDSAKIKASRIVYNHS